MIAYHVAYTHSHLLYTALSAFMCKILLKQIGCQCYSSVLDYIQGVDKFLITIDEAPRLVAARNSAKHVPNR